MDECKNGSRPCSSSNYLFLSNSITRIVLIFARLPKGQSRPHHCWTPKKISCLACVGPCLNYSQVECKSWQLCCLHFHICGQVYYKGWLCLLFLWWWLMGFERHQVLPRHYKFKIHSKFAVINSMHCTNPKFPNKKINFLWIPPGFLHPCELNTNISLYMS